MITKQGIKANPKKVKAFIDMISPRTIREVQSLNGKLAALGCFLANFCRESIIVLQDVKVVPTPGETLTLYLAVSHETISSVLMAERKNVQRPDLLHRASGAGLILTDPNRKEITYALRFDFPTSNNEAEYEALIADLPPEIGVPTYRIQSYEENKNTTDLRLNLELLEERRNLASLCKAKYKHQIKRYYNSKVRHAQLKVGDFVLCKNEASRQERHKKLKLNWEGL
nr:hypothetical protein [Tanacetum cinerariifolium]